MSATFLQRTDWEQSSGPLVNRKVHKDNLWPQTTNSGSGTKDALANGKHPVLAIGGGTAADGRPLNVTGVMVTYNDDSEIAIINVADGMIVRQYVANVLTYDQGDAATFEQAPVPGQPVYVDDSDDLAEGVTLSMSPLNDEGLKNPLAGVLFWCQDEYADSGVGGPNSSQTFDSSLPNELTQQVYCVMLFNGMRELA